MDHHTIYFNMCNHYRRLCNVKPAVDTGISSRVKRKSTFRRSERNNHKTTCVTKQKEITTETKVPQKSQKYSPPLDKSKVYCSRYHRSFRSNTIEDDKEFIVPNNPHQPKILKSNAQSKIRNMKVYYPPRKRIIPKDSNKVDKTEKSDIKENEISAFKQLPVILSAATISSEDLSEDSAYNEEEGIMSGDSRGPSPPQRNEKYTFRQKDHRKIPRSKDYLYVKFLKDITDDILRKDIFTNKALKNVINHHVQLNINRLDQTRMMKEVEFLEERLGIPKEDKLNDIGYGLGELDYKEHSSFDNDVVYSKKELIEIKSTNNDTSSMSNNEYDDDYEEESNDEESVIQSKNNMRNKNNSGENISNKMDIRKEVDEIENNDNKNHNKNIDNGDDDNVNSDNESIITGNEIVLTDDNNDNEIVLTDNDNDNTDNEVVHTDNENDNNDNDNEIVLSDNDNNDNEIVITDNDNDENDNEIELTGNENDNNDNDNEIVLTDNDNNDNEDNNNDNEIIHTDNEIDEYDYGNDKDNDK